MLILVFDQKRVRRIFLSAVCETRILPIISGVCEESLPRAEEGREAEEEGKGLETAEEEGSGDPGPTATTIFAGTEEERDRKGRENCEDSLETGREEHRLAVLTEGRERVRERELHRKASGQDDRPLPVHGQMREGEGRPSGGVEEERLRDDRRDKQARMKNEESLERLGEEEESEEGSEGEEVRDEKRD